MALPFSEGLNELTTATVPLTPPIPSFTSSATSATMLITFLGFPSAIGQWAPFSLVCRSRDALAVLQTDKTLTAWGSHPHDKRSSSWRTRYRRRPIYPSCRYQHAPTATTKRRPVYSRG